MKSIILLASALALSATVASATTTTVHLTGSTAFRSATHTAIYNYLQAHYSNVEADYVGSSFGGASQAIFDGADGSGNHFRVVTFWSGSDKGILDTATPNTLSWLDGTNLTGSSGQHQITGTPSTTDSHAPEATMADNSQTESGHVAGFTALSGTQVGVVPFVFAKGATNDTTVAASLANVTNISSSQLWTLLGSKASATPADGEVAPLSVLTGNSADVIYPAIVFGRDNGSGTRLDTFTESGYGRDTVPMQYEVSATSGGAITAVSLNASGTSGYAGGGTLIANLNTPVASGKNYVTFGYAGLSDASNLAGAGFNSTTGTFSGSNILTYNGVAMSYANVREGKYSLWNYEYLYKLPSGLSSDQNTLITGVGTQLTNTDAAISGILLSTMDVIRLNTVTDAIESLNPPTLN